MRKFGHFFEYFILGKICVGIHGILPLIQISIKTHEFDNIPNNIFASKAERQLGV
jgi:hypothetical protein